ncbi:peptide methionine sulfoxide reductase [Nibribacter ruber]|uniref:peptide-methionine (S)-S-oxide reductase n=1 Tax=Nibribacter ruber TaxID=2698458 RepID=A0A6P1NUM3_9BACT|nr:peptide-methionine (S)-S-oxide reductase [Nibribacter ruber]QHL86750.1 peptide methionine sulfoxide reductase [Nibribacter ruber]
MATIQTPPTLETATFSMGCFWKPEALFGAVPGVVSTSAGYAGGTSPAPTYWHLKDHLETVQVTFEATQLSFEELLALFFIHHSATRIAPKRQYASAVFYHSPVQQNAIEKAIQAEEARQPEKIQTLVLPFTQYHLAEERHQKWNLKRVPPLLQELQVYYPDELTFNAATTVARVNGFVAGFGTEAHITAELECFGLSGVAQDVLWQKWKQARLA